MGWRDLRGGSRRGLSDMGSSGSGWVPWEKDDAKASERKGRERIASMVEELSVETVARRTVEESVAANRMSSSRAGTESHRPMIPR